MVSMCFIKILGSFGFVQRSTANAGATARLVLTHVARASLAIAPAFEVARRTHPKLPIYSKIKYDNIGIIWSGRHWADITEY